MKTATSLLAPLLILITTAGSAFAWGPHGHMLVAAIAWQKLTPPVKAEVTRLLKENPNYDDWIQGVAAADVDEVAFITAATWPDFIKGADGYSNDGQHPPSGSKAGQNIGYDDMLQHRYWHYYDTPFSPDHTKLGKPDGVNALTQIQKLTAALKSSTDDSIRSYDLVWLEHIVGDVHQPLHATARFDKQDKKGDQGGNLVLLCTANQAAAGNLKKCKATLHSLWDGLPGSGSDPITVRNQAAGLAAANATAAANLNPVDWINESFQSAKVDVYVAPIGIGDGPFTPDAAYRAHGRIVAAERVALAGARLANLLNANVTTH